MLQQKILQIEAQLKQKSGQKVDFLMKKQTDTENVMEEVIKNVGDLK